MYSIPLYRRQNLGAASTAGAMRQVGWVDVPRFYVEQYQPRVRAPVGDPPMDRPPKLGAWPTYAMYGPPRPAIFQVPFLPVGAPQALFPVLRQPRIVAAPFAQAAYFLRLPSVQASVAPPPTTSLLQFRYDP